MKLKGQASIEYLAVFGLALALSAPFILSAQTTLIDLNLGSGTMEAQNSLQKLETSVNTVAASGEPAQRTMEVNLPDNYEGGQVTDNAVVFTVRSRTGESDLVKTFDTQLDPESEVPQSPGFYELTVYMEDGNATIEVVN